jgi:hypothetical protein|tara:strand:- start:347 stop:559 length:213 start_codon:yes stop_codon:yes gene_type:complete
MNDDIGISIRTNMDPRDKRNRILATTDIYVLADHPTSKKAEWKTYRKALRDMDFSDSDNITWPTAPEEDE